MALSRDDLRRRNQRNHYRVNRKKLLKQRREDRLANPAKYRARDRRYREANRDKRDAYMVLYRLAKKKAA
jgi:hypothetical protein